MKVGGWVNQKKGAGWLHWNVVLSVVFVLGAVCFRVKPLDGIVRFLFLLPKCGW